MGSEMCIRDRNADAVSELSSYSEGAGSVSGIVADMGDKSSTEEFISDVLSGGDVDLLINNVGASPSRNFLYMKDEDWTELHELNLMSAVRCTRAFLPAMREKKWGRVLMISSSAGKYPNAALVDYGTTKAAMISMGKSLAVSYTHLTLPTICSV